jgi:hypothetical protein
MKRNGERGVRIQLIMVFLQIVQKISNGNLANIVEKTITLRRVL